MHTNLCEAQWLAYAFPCRRFAVTLADDRARLRVDADRYSFIVSDLHRLLLAGFSGALRKILYVIDPHHHRAGRKRWWNLGAAPGRKRKFNEIAFLRSADRAGGSVIISA